MSSTRTLSESQLAEELFYFYSPTRKVTFSWVAGCVGKGWTPLLSELCAKLFALGWDGGLEQVKEKFGSLRFYFINTCGPYSDIAFDVVNEAEAQSSQTCEECGEWGEIKGKGWLRCLCKKCREAQNAGS